MAHDAFLRALYASVISDDAFRSVLDALSEMFHCPSAALFYVDQARPAAAIDVAVGPFSGEAQRLYHQVYAKDDPAPAAMTRLQVGEVARTDDLFDAATRAASPFLHQFYYPLGLREAMGGPVVNDAGRFGILAVHRGPDRDPFTEDEAAAFAGLVGHVATALELRRAFYSLETKVAALGDVADASPVGIIVLGRNGVLNHANLRARHIMARRDGLRVGLNGVLGASDPGAHQSLRTAIEHHGPRMPSLLRVPRDDGSVYVLRIAPSGDPALPSGTVVTICDPAPDGRDAAALLSSALGLTNATAKLVAALLKNDDMKTYARQAGISYNTARFHLRSAFSATGMRRQSDLVRLASAVVRDLS